MFEGLAIDEKCADALRAAARSGRLSHAVMLEGADAAIRLAAAKELAQAIVCTADLRPCGVCRACKKAVSGNHPDIHLLEKEEKSAFIRVDAVRALREQAMLLPNDGARSVFLIAEAQNMNVQAQNALLKMLEEPAKHVRFILTVESKAALLETIRSRCTAYALSQSDFAAPAQTSEAEEAAAAVLRGLCENEFALLSACAVFQKDKALLQDALAALELLLRDALVCASAASPMTRQDALTAMLRARFTPRRLLALRDTAVELLAALRANANVNLTASALSALFYEIKVSEDQGERMNPI